MIWACTVVPMTDKRSPIDIFWDNLSGTIFHYPKHSLDVVVQDAEILSDLHIRQNVLCSCHGRQVSTNGLCPCVGHPPGVHKCSKQDPRLAGRYGFGAKI